MKKVTDPALLQELEGGPKKVNDPALLAELEGKQKTPSMFALEPPAQAVVDTMANVPKSAIGLVGDTAKALYSPVETLKGLRSALRGAISNVLPEGSVTPYDEMERDRAIANAVGKHFSDRYGGLRKIGKTIQEDPVGASADVSLASMLAGGALKTAGLSGAADTAAKISQATDPFLQGARAVKSVVKPTYIHSAGKTTGLGPHVIAEQLKGTPEFQAAMDSMGNKINRQIGKDGEVLSESKVADMADDALSRIKQIRGEAYRTELNKLQNVNKELPIDDIKIKSDEWLKRYNVNKADDGSLDFSRSTVSGTSASEVEQVYRMVQDWGSKAKDTTPAMLDVLKRRLDDFYSTSRNSRAMVTDLKKSVQGKIESQVPEYAKMTADYGKASDLIKEMERALGAGDRASADTAIRRLTMALREDKSLRRDLLKVLDQAGEGNVTAAVAGVLSKPIANRSLESLAAAGMGVGAATFFSNPYLAALVPLASPRIVGELNVVLGKIGRAAPYGRGAGLLAYQAGNIPTQAP